MDFAYEGTARADRETVWDVLTDYPGYAKFTPARKVVVEKEGSPQPNGVGTERAIHAVGPPVRERIVVFEPPERFAYVLFKGAPLRNHRGDVTLTEAPGGGTHIHYAIHTEPAVPVVGHLATRIVKQAVKGIFNGVIKESERRAR